MAVLYRQPKSVDKARFYLEKAIAIRQKLRLHAGGLSAQLLWDKQLIASCLVLQQKYAAAADYLIGEAKSLPKNDRPDTIYWQQSMLNYSQVLTRLSQDKDAQRLALAARGLAPR